MTSTFIPFIFQYQYTKVGMLFKAKLKYWQKFLTDLDYKYLILIIYYRKCPFVLHHNTHS